MSFLILAYKREIAALFTQEPQVRALIVKCMPIVAIKFAPHGYQGLLGLGLIPALGMQKQRSYVTIFSAYLITLPAALYYAFILE